MEHVLLRGRNSILILNPLLRYLSNNLFSLGAVVVTLVGFAHVGRAVSSKQYQQTPLVDANISVSCPF